MSASVAAVINPVEAVPVLAGGSATAPVVYEYAAAPVYAQQPVYEVAAPVYVTSDGQVQEVNPTLEAPVVYSSASPYTYQYAAPPVTYAAPMTYQAVPGVDTYQPGERIVYQSVTTGQSYPGSVVDMYTDGGCQIILDIDGGVKDLYLQDMVRLSREGAVAEVKVESTTVTKKAKKVKSNKKKGCC